MFLRPMLCLPSHLGCRTWLFPSFALSHEIHQRKSILSMTPCFRRLEVYLSLTIFASQASNCLRKISMSGPSVCELDPFPSLVAFRPLPPYCPCTVNVLAVILSRTVLCRKPNIGRLDQAHSFTVNSVHSVNPAARSTDALRCPADDISIRGKISVVELFGLDPLDLFGTRTEALHLCFTGSKPTR